jgi:hypothetical protein
MGTSATFVAALDILKLQRSGAINANWSFTHTDNEGVGYLNITNLSTSKSIVNFADNGAVGFNTLTPYTLTDYRFINISDVTGGGLMMQTAGVNKAVIYNTSTGLFIGGGVVTIGDSGIVASTGVKIATLTGTGTEMVTVDNAGNLSRQAIPSPGGGGTVITVGVNSANGFAGTSSGGANPALTLSTTINSPILAGNGTAIFAATTTGSGSTAVLSASPALTGTPTAPTQTAGDNSTKIATTAYVYTATTRQLAEFITNVQNSGSSMTDLYTFTIPANTLVNNGDKIVFYFAGRYASNSNNKLLSIDFGSSGFGPVQSTGFGFDWQINGYLIKESSTTYRISISKEDDVTGGVINGVGTVSSFTSSNIFKLRGDGDATGDITAYSGYLEFKPAAL